MPEFAYTPCYCEENVYLLLKTLSGGMGLGDPSGQGQGCEPGDYRVVFVTNGQRGCAFLEQKAVPPGLPIVWDYHVILLSGRGEAALIRDLDTRLDLPCAATEYLDRTFPRGVEESFRPLFRLIPADRYLGGFSSDRRHMRRLDGSWLQDPPPWRELRGSGTDDPHELARILDLQDPRWGPLVDLASLWTEFTPGRFSPDSSGSRPRRS